MVGAGSQKRAGAIISRQHFMRHRGEDVFDELTGIGVVFRDQDFQEKNLCAKEVGQLFFQFAEVKRLGDIIIAAGFDGTFTISHHRVGGEGNNRDVLKFGGVLDLPRRRPAIHARQR